MIRVLFVGTLDPQCANSWAGTPYWMLKGLIEIAEVETLVLSRRRRAVMRGVRAAAGENWDVGRRGWVLEGYRSEIERRIRGGRFDLVFSPSSLPFGAWRGDLPALFWTDAVYSQLAGLYDGFATDPKSMGLAQEQERRSISAADLACYSSNWALDAAIGLVPNGNVMKFPFGPNMSAAFLDGVRRRRAAGVRRQQRLQLLWIGNDWERKGGAIALQTCRLLRRVGINAEIAFVGAPPKEQCADHERYLGRLDKQVPDDLGYLGKALEAADVLILPSLADCTPIVLSEAAAVGLPVCVSETGGMAELVKDYELGWTAPLSSNMAGAMASALTDLAEGKDGINMPEPMPTYSESFTSMFEELSLPG